MSDPVHAYALPTWRLLRWLTDPGPEVPQDIRTRLISGFFTSAAPLVFGAIVNTAVNMVAVILHPSATFMALLAVDVAAVMSRIILLVVSRSAVNRGQPTPTNIFLLCGLCWSGVIGIGTAMCLASGDPVLQFLAPTTMMGITSGIATRNSGAPRFAIAQIMLCDVPLQFVLPFLGHPWMLLSVLQCPLFIVGMIATVHRLNQSYIVVVLAERDSERRATHDSLTGKLNRDGLTAALSRDLHRAALHDGAFALLYMDLDGFKSVNDGFGHAAGDELLRRAADRFAAAIPETCRLGRFGGDEFIVLAPGFDAVAAAAMGDALVAAIGHPFEMKPGFEIPIGVSIGIASATPQSTVDNLLAAADAALYQAKSGGKGRCILATERQAVDRQAA